MKYTLEQIKSVYGNDVRLFTRSIAGHEYRYAEVWDAGIKKQRQFSLGRADIEQTNVKPTVKDTGMKTKETTVKNTVKIYNGPRPRWDLTDLTEDQKQKLIDEQRWVYGRSFMVGRQAGRSYQELADLLLRRFGVLQ